MDAASLFNKQADTYARIRPTYPPELFQFLASLCVEKNLAWDCATGNGQAARGLVDYFKKVIATDVSDNQLAHAAKHKQIEYKKSPAENIFLDDASVDMVTVAQALHWIDLKPFFDEVHRVLKPKGVIAVWCYNHAQITDDIDSIVNNFSRVILKDYWAPGVQYVWSGYKTLPFPFREVETPTFKLSVQWNLEDMFSYLWSWSPVQTYVQKNGQENPIEHIRSELEKAWGDSKKIRSVQWDLHLRVGTK